MKKEWGKGEGGAEILGMSVFAEGFGKHLLILFSSWFLLYGLGNSGIRTEIIAFIFIICSITISIVNDIRNVML